MSAIYRLSPFLLVLLLLAGCQGSRPAFYFGSRPAPAAPSPAVAWPDSAKALARPEPGPELQRHQHTVRPRNQAAPRRPVVRPLARRSAGAASAARPMRRLSYSAPARPRQPADDWDTFGLLILLLLLSGVGLVILLAGIIAGSWVLALVGLGSSLLALLLFLLISDRI